MQHGHRGYTVFRATCLKNKYANLSTVNLIWQPLTMWPAVDFTCKQDLTIIRKANLNAELDRARQLLSQLPSLWDSRFSQQCCCWGLKFSGMWSCVIGRGVINLLKTLNIFHSITRPKSITFLAFAQNYWGEPTLWFHNPAFSMYMCVCTYVCTCVDHSITSTCFSHGTGVRLYTAVPEVT